MAKFLDEIGLSTLISLIKSWVEDQIRASGSGGETYVLPQASADALGGIRIGYSGDGAVLLDRSGRAYVDLSGVLPIASAGALGGIKTGYTTSDGDRNYAVAVDGSGNAYVNVPWTASETEEPYVLPAASADTRGGIKVGSGLAVTDTDVLGVSTALTGRIDALEAKELPVASAETLGGIKVGLGLEIDGEGVLDCTAAAVQIITDEEIDTIFETTMAGA